MNLFDDWGCGYYRCALPTYQCYGDLSKNGVNIFLSKELHSDEDHYNAYVLHRMPAEPSVFMMQKAQRAGYKFVVELDDDIFSIPDWMPSEEYKTPKWSVKRAIDIADEVWVSTEPLAETIGKPEKTHVLPNLVDCNAFLPTEEPATDPIRILWTGSMWHEYDLQQIVPAVNSIINEYGDKVQFLFWGYLPNAFADFVRTPGQNVAVMHQKKEYGTNLLYLEGLPFRFYHDKIVQLKPYIGLAPLFDCKFNDSKSSLKFLEYTMAGAATIATNLPPYACVKNGEDALLVAPEDSDGWYKSIKLLIEDRQLRDGLVANARKKVFERHSWQSYGKKKLWLDAFQRIS